MTISSISDLLNAQGHFPRQRFVEYFSGKQISAIWTEHNRSGTGTYAMIDGIDEGYSVSTDSSAGATAIITHGDIQQFSQTSSIIIGTCRRVTATSTQCRFGLLGIQGFGSLTEKAHILEQTGQTFKLCENADGATAKTTASTIPIDVNFTDNKIELTSSSAIFSINGTLQVTNTSNLPDVPLQPYFGSSNLTTAVSESRIRYLECYNK